MSVFDLKGGGSGNNWNYSDPNKQGFMEMIEGTIVEISNPQSINFGTKKPEFWDDGNPKRNLCVIVKGRSGQELNWIFAPKSNAANACLAALDPQGDRPQVSIEELLGKMVRIQTQTGVYNSQNPRPWWVTILGDGDIQSVRGIKDLSQGQPMQQLLVPQQQRQVQAPPTQQQAPAPQVQYAQQQAAQALGYAPQPAQQQPSAPANQAPYEQDPTGGYYEQDIPF